MIYSIANCKGGVSKSTSSLNIGAGLSRLGKKVLLIDLDPQSNLSQNLNIVEQSPNIYEILKGEQPMEPFTISEGLDLVPSVLDLVGAERELHEKYRKEDLLTKALEPIKDNYDFILIDCPPAINLLTINAFVCSDEIIIPMEPEKYATNGMKMLTDFIDMIQAEANPGLKIAGCVIAKKERTILHNTFEKAIRDKYKVFDSVIRKSVSIPEAQACNTDIFSYDDKSNGAIDYMSLIKEILK